MTWRGSTTFQDRIFACLPYLLPIIEGLVFGLFLFSQFPLLGILLLPLAPVIFLYSQLGPFASLIVITALFVFVVRQEKIHHFIRFNSMQAILLTIVVFLCQQVGKILGNIPGSGFALQTVSSVFLLAVVVIVVYSCVRVLQGRYAEIPVISEQAYMQIR
jgi:uncharacterized membrane protein